MTGPKGTRRRLIPSENLRRAIWIARAVLGGEAAPPPGKKELGASEARSSPAGQGADVTAFGMNQTLCKCGHMAVEHYDSYDFCTWILDGKCDCEEYAPDGPEKWIVWKDETVKKEKDP